MSLNTMVKKVAGLADTKDVTEAEKRFIRQVVAQTENGKNTSSLDEAQIDRLELIYDANFFPS